MRRDFNVLMSDLNGTTREKLVVTTAIVPLEKEDCGCGCGCYCTDGDEEVYAARVEMDDGQVRGVISHDSMESALGVAVAQAMADLEDCEEEDSYDCDYDYDEEEEEDYGDEEESVTETVQKAVNKAVEAILKKLSTKEESHLSIRHITALKSAVDEIGFDRAVEVLEKLNKKN